MFNFKLSSKSTASQESAKPKSKVSIYALIGLVVAILGGAAYWYLIVMDEPAGAAVAKLPTPLPKPGKPKIDAASAVSATQISSNPVKTNDVENEAPFNEMHAIFCKMDKKQITSADVNRYSELNHAVEKMMSRAKEKGTKDVVELTGKIDKSMDKLSCN